MPLKKSNVKMQFSDICTKQCIVSVIGLFLVINGLIIAVYWTDIFQMMMAKEMALRPNSRIYDTWKSPPLAINLDIYFFNWTNPESINNDSVKPILEEIGPYRFIDKPDKVDIVWHTENSTVSFKRKNYFYFDEEGSNGTLDDLITTVNMVALSAGAKAINWGFFKQKTVSIGLNMYGQQIAITRLAKELLFDGFQDDMIDAAKELPIFGDDVTVPFDRAGWFYPRNGTENLTGIYNMYTGQDDIRKIGKMHTWNYKTHTGFYQSHCGMVNGSAGEFYPPKLEKNGSISFFNPDLCRTVTFDYEKATNIEDVEGYKFSGGPRSVDNGTLYPENECFCNGECVPSGVMNITACRFGAPVFMSYPHFYQADRFYVDQVEGLNPSKKKHEFFMILEPQTGIALEVAARFQINLLIQPISNVGLYRHVNKVFMPILWFEQKVKINKEMAAELRMVLKIILTGQICAGIIFSIGLIMLFWFPIEKCIRKNRNNEFKKPKKSKSLKLKDNLEIVNDRESQPEGSPLLGKTDNVNNKLPKVVFIKPQQQHQHQQQTNTIPSSSILITEKL